MKIIDARVRLRTPQLLKAWTSDLKPYFRDYIEWYNMEKRLIPLATSELLEQATESGIEKIVVCGGNKGENDHVIEVASKYPQIIPVAGVSIANGIRSGLDEIKRCNEHKVAAMTLSPFINKINANDKKLYPLYGLCEMLRLPIIVHGSMHYWRESYMWHGGPEYIDEVAVDFPELKLIISHAGNGFGPSVLGVAQRHPNVYLEFSALRPKYIAPEFVNAANTYLKKKCIFGTDYPLIEFDEQINVWKESLREDVYENFFYQNILDALFGDIVPL